MKLKNGQRLNKKERTEKRKNKRWVITNKCGAALHVTTEGEYYCARRHSHHMYTSAYVYRDTYTKVHLMPEHKCDTYTRAYEKLSQCARGIPQQ